MLSRSESAEVPFSSEVREEAETFKESLVAPRRGSVSTAATNKSVLKLERDAKSIFSEFYNATRPGVAPKSLFSMHQDWSGQAQKPVVDPFTKHARKMLDVARGVWYKMGGD